MSRSTRAVAAAAGLVLVAGRLGAQVPDTARATGRRPAAADSVRWVRPSGAFLRSLVLPGWGQAVLDRHVAGALFVAWEGISLSMAIKADQQVDYLKAVDSPALEAKRQEREDWLVLLAFTHLFAGLDAFVAAHLRDFPGDLNLRVAPSAVWWEIPLPRLR